MEWCSNNQFTFRNLFYNHSMINVLETTKFVVENSRLVKISKSQIEKLTSTINSNDLATTESGWTHYQCSYDELVKLLYIFNSVNFCYWAGKNEPKWTVEFGEEKIDGSMALFRCIEEEAKKNPRFTEAKVLASLSEDEWKRVIKGNVEIPLFKKRLECLRELGRVLDSDFGGSYTAVVQQSGGSAIRLLDLLINKFPKFNDSALFENREVGFYKRAQLLVKGVSDAMALSGREPLSDLDKLTAFADYKIPQLLRRLGIIEYVPKLAQKIDSYELIASETREEVEIRANTVWAVEMIRQDLSKRFGQVTSAQVDTMLWKKSQEKTGDEKPYHRTLTIAY